MTQPADEVDDYPIPVELIFDIGVTPFDLRLYAVLGVCLRDHGRTPSAAELARKLNVSSPTVFRSVTKLAARGWIERTSNPPQPTQTTLFRTPKPLSKKVRRERRKIRP